MYNTYAHQGILRVKDMWYIHTTEYIFSLKKEILSFATTWMNPESIMLNEKLEKDKYIGSHFHIIES